MANISVVATNKFVGLSDGNILNWCPGLNLLTISMNKTSLWVYRLNGERIYSVNNKSHITSMSAIYDGSYFCLAGADGLIKIYDSNSGNLVKIIEKSFSHVDLMQYNFHDYEKTKSSKFKDLFHVDILKSLPKLTSTVSSVANNAASSTPEDILELGNSSTLNYLVIVDSSTLSLNFNGLLNVSDIDFPSGSWQILAHLDTNDPLDQFFLVKDGDKLVLAQLYNDLSSSDRSHLIDMILKICKVIAILNHVRDNLRTLETEIKPFFVLYDRYLNNLLDSIQEKGDDSQFTLSLYFTNALFTNLVPETLKDYWLNQFGERGFNKLNKLGNTVYDMCRNIIFKVMVASLERLLVLLNELRSLGQWFKDSENKLHSGLNLNLINDVITQCKSLLKTFYKVIWDINDEQKAFNHFMTWVKHEIIDKIAKEDDMASYLSSPDKPIYNHKEITKYINDHLFSSRLWTHFQIDLSANDILVPKESSKVLVVEQFESLSTKFGEEVTSFQQLMKGNLLFKESPYSVEFPPDVHDLKLKHGTNAAILCGLSQDNQTMNIMRFSTTDTASVSNTLRFSGQVVAYEFNTGSQLLVVLQEAGSFQMVLFEVDQVFDRESEIAFKEISPIKRLTSISLRSPKSLAISRNETVSYGCLLDANKQDYIVFEI